MWLGSEDYWAKAEFRWKMQKKKKKCLNDQGFPFRMRQKRENEGK